jgi:predicted nucleic acid-binding protein
VTWLLDTNVVSELRKTARGTADPQVVAWAGQADPAMLFISAITVHELERGVRRIERRDARQGRVLRQWMEGQVLPAFDQRILPIDTSIALRSAALNVPDQRPLRDSLIEATALEHGMTIVTRNVRDFANSAAGILNPWNFPDAG